MSTLGFLGDVKKQNLKISPGRGLHGEDVLRYAVHDAVRSSEGPADLTWPPAPPSPSPSLKLPLTATEFYNIVSQSTILEKMKRNVLKLSAMFFDPFGLISPVTLQSKLIFKSLCINKIEWYNVIPKDLPNKWTTFVNELSNTTVHIDRYMGVEENTNNQILEIHGFADASSQAFAAAVYLRVVTQGYTTVKLWCAKSKVAAMKQLTIPRLELLSCELLTKLIKSVNLAIEKEMIVNRIICWTDSKIAYYWITQVNKDWKLWVENRVSKIRNIVPPGNWRHVPGTENPADISTRELKSSLIVNSTLWWPRAAILVINRGELAIKYPCYLRYKNHRIKAKSKYDYCFNLDDGECNT